LEREKEREETSWALAVPSSGQDVSIVEFIIADMQSTHNTDI
jgi:hypothetical protein